MSPNKTILFTGLAFIGSLILFMVGRLSANLGAGSATLLMWGALVLFIVSILLLILYIKKVNLK